MKYIIVTCTILILFPMSCKIGMNRIQKYSKQLPEKYKKLKLDDSYDTLYKNVDSAYDYIHSLALKSEEGVIVAEEWEYKKRGFLIKRKTFEYEGFKYMEYWYYTNEELSSILYKVLVFDEQSNPVGYITYEALKFE